MKIKEFLKISEEMLKRLHVFGIKVNDYKYIGLIEDYEKMKADGEKTTYAVAILSQRYGICERKVYKILSRLNREC